MASRALAADATADEQGRVLPWFLRRPARLVARAFSQGHLVPSYWDKLAMVGVIGGAALYGSIMGGQFPVAVERATIAMGLGISEVKIEGHTHTQAQDVFAVLGLEQGRSLFSIDSADAKAALATLPWIEHGEIRKSYPGTLTVSLVEKQPAAIWQTGDVLSVVEADGSVIGGYSGNSLRNLPLLVGKGAADNAKDFMAVVARYPAVHEQVHAYVYVGQRRWNLRLTSGVTLKLPELAVEDALAAAMQLDGDYGLFSRDIASVDLRVPGQMVVALTDNSMAARMAALEAKGIDFERGEGSI